MLAPIRMLPAYRSGAETPWGGSALRTLFGRALPDERTGESLEVSALPGLCSRDERGVGLDALIRTHGEELVGTQVKGAFPLLLKLLDARDTLSVQVHPGDEYAARNEGKLGKTEAWVILHAAPGAELIYGVRPGVTREELACAARKGAAVESCLRRVRVRAGEAYAIPAGMVHAVGKGIVLYEIQQSSDVTYRFYDFERTDAQGNKRELHLDRALDVVDVSLRLDAARPVPLESGARGVRERLLENPIFTLDRFRGARGMSLARDARRFAMLTALSSARISYAAGELALEGGDTALLPAGGYDLTLACAGEALLALPTLA